MLFKDLYLIKVFILFSIYFITAKFGLLIDPVNQFATLVWLPSGIALAYLLILGRQFWPGILLGAFFTNLFTGAPIISALGISIGNTLEAVVATYLLRNFIQFKNSISRLKDVLGLAIFGGCISTALSALVGVVSIFAGGVINQSQIVNTFLAWWVGDMISILVITPFLLVWSTKIHFDLKFSRIAEASIIFISFLVSFLIIFKDFYGLSFGSKFSVYMVFPLLIWAALRFEQIGTVSLIFILSVLATLNTLQGFGPFATSLTYENLLSLQTFMAITSVTAMTLAAVITERKQSEKTKDEFISIAAHELKTPLTTIKGYIQLLEKNISKKDQKSISYLSKIHLPIDNLTRLISDFFEVSKIQAGKLELQKEEFLIDKLVEDAVEGLQQTNIKHKIHILGKTDKQIMADKFRINQVLTNILSNAIKFSPKADKINLYLTTEKKNIRIDIEDFGIGISRRDLDKVFNRFYQANTQIRQSIAGLGLGLYISSEIIRKHGGKIWVRSQKGKGTTFSFILPINNYD